MKTKLNYSDEDIEEFNKWGFTLSPFQKSAIKGIIEEKNVIITAHTGSGKTLPAEFAISHFCKKGKKVIYCSPIKALSNEKYNDFKSKYENEFTVGILTGDIKFDPEADLIVMTTEILRNNLFKIKMMESNKKIELDFEIDIENELACVIFDEIHYINDRDRGKVWEETIMMLPNQCQIVGLSATINKPEHFCEWIEKTKEREVWLCPNKERVVPLTHKAWLSYPKSIINKLPNELKNEFIEFIDKEIDIKRPKDRFNDRNFYCIEKMIKYFNVNNIRINKYFVLNKLISHLYFDNKLPAICFCFSRKQTLELAQKIELNLFENGEKHSSTVKAECINILKKLPNYKEYLELEEFHIIIKLLERGIAIHHSGINSVFREMIELLFKKRYVRLLIATETFAVGINMPTRSVIFTSMQKFDGNNFRNLLPHEYTQMAGRAGRRNIDVEGHVYHLFNYYSQSCPNIQNMKHIITGNPQTIQSRFYIHYNLLLRLIGSGKTDFSNFVESSMINSAIKEDLIRAEKEKESLQKRYLDYSELVKKLNTNITVLENYQGILVSLPKKSQKQKKRAIKELENIKKSSRSFEKDYEFYKELSHIENDMARISKDIYNINHYIDDQIAIHIGCLEKNNFIIEENDSEYKLTKKGIIASNIQEIHSMAMAEVINNNALNDLTTIELVVVLSIFTPIRLSDANKFHTLINVNVSSRIKDTISLIEQSLKKYYDTESYLKTAFIESYDIHYDMTEFMYAWCIADDEQTCKSIINEAKRFDIFLGEFIKSILKINNIANELEKICEITENFKLLETVKNIPKQTLKYVVTAESLYV